MKVMKRLFVLIVSSLLLVIRISYAFQGRNHLTPKAESRETNHHNDDIVLKFNQNRRIFLAGGFKN